MDLLVANDQGRGRSEGLGDGDSGTKRGMSVRGGAERAARDAFVFVVSAAILPLSLTDG